MIRVTLCKCVAGRMHKLQLDVHQLVTSLQNQRGSVWFRNTPKVHGVGKAGLEQMLMNKSWHKAVFNTAIPFRVFSRRTDPSANPALNPGTMLPLPARHTPLQSHAPHGTKRNFRRGSAQARNTGRRQEG